MIRNLQKPLGKAVCIFVPPEHLDTCPDALSSLWARSSFFRCLVTAPGISAGSTSFWAVAPSRVSLINGFHSRGTKVHDVCTHGTRIPEVQMNPDYVPWVSPGPANLGSIHYLHHPNFRAPNNYRTSGFPATPHDIGVLLKWLGKAHS